MTMSQTSEPRNVWDLYTSAWQAPDAAEKARTLHASVDTDCVYRDPLIKAEGHTALIQYMLGFHQQVPGGFFKTTSFRTHSSRSIATWQMCDAQGAAMSEGVSYGEYGEDGKLLAMTGFFDPPAA